MTSQVAFRLMTVLAKKATQSAIKGFSFQNKTGMIVGNPKAKIV